MIAETTELDKHTTLQDQVRLFLNSVGSREVHITVADLAKQLSRPEASVYQALNIMRKAHEIELVKEPSVNGARPKIVGLVINKLEPSGRTYKRAADRSGKVIRIQPNLDNLAYEDNFPLDNLVTYLHKKLAIEDMKVRALGAGLDESVITFVPDPLAEEGIMLLKAFTDLKKEFENLKDMHRQQGFDLEAEKRNVQHLKGRLRKETEEMLNAQS